MTDPALAAVRWARCSKVPSCLPRSLFQPAQNDTQDFSPITA